MLYATIDATGLATGFYDDRMHNVPSGAVSISSEVWAVWIADTERQRWDAEAGALVPHEPPPTPPVVPRVISRRQLLLQLAAAGLITAEEALAAATTGAVPATIDAVFAQLPPQDALGARITWATMSTVERSHDLVAALVAASVATEAEVDALFIAAAAR